MKKILVISNMYPNKKFPQYGIFVRRIVDQLQSIGFSVDVSSKEKSSNVLTKIFSYILFYLKTIFKVFCYKELYIHYPSHCALPVLIALFFVPKRRITLHFHGSDIILERNKSKKFHEIKIFFTNLLLRHASQIVVPSEYFSIKLRSILSIDNSIFDVIVYPSGGVKEVFKPKDKKADYDCVKLGYAGRMTDDKGMATLLDILRRLDNSFLLYCAGDDDGNFSKIFQENLGQRFRYYGALQQSDLIEFYQEIDLFIFPTQRDSESLGLVVIEALACGTPVITSDYGASGELVNPNENGSIVAMRDVSKFVSEIKIWVERMKSGDYVPLKISRTVDRFRSNETERVLCELFLGENK